MTRFMYFFGFVGATIIGTATLSAQLKPTDPIYLDAANQSEKPDFESLLAASYAVLSSPEFRANLASLDSIYPEVYLSYQNSGNPGDAITGTVATLSDIVSAKAPDYYFFRSPVALVGDSFAADARTGWTGTNQEGAMAIGREHLARWRSTNEVERSCAINTVAHEISHLVSTDQSTFYVALSDNKARTLTSVTADGRFREPPLPIGTYLLGSVAQCTWLQQQGYSPSIDLKTCVAIFGTRGFSKNRCKSFPAGSEVKFQTGLPTPHVVGD